ncbi:hypothetical protein [Acidihalobacter ferrooxydans]|uniref:Uncharacterized protein n=1 Tax=Acidihalobacter ferrooxydans TaxID=1765967 RepID=A0A1P8UFV7_9GAMM|nr:hypothetical protein [Acidihalobacter ferrooxydans]APZ42644.1 hypothetical protein BW247_05640 [Acidihalobacter ferrooxydans]
MLIESRIVGQVEVPHVQFEMAEALFLLYDQFGHKIVPPDQVTPDTKSKVLDVLGVNGRHPADQVLSISHPVFGVKNPKKNEKSGEYGFVYNPMNGVAGIYVDESEVVIFLNAGNLFDDEFEKKSGKRYNQYKEHPLISGPWYRAEQLQRMDGVTHKVVLNPDSSGKICGLPVDEFISGVKSFGLETTDQSLSDIAMAIVAGHKRPTGRYLLFKMAPGFRKTASLLRVNRVNSKNCPEMVFVEKESLGLINFSRYRYYAEVFKDFPVEAKKPFLKLLKSPSNRELERRVREILRERLPGRRLRELYPTTPAETNIVNAIINDA